MNRSRLDLWKIIESIAQSINLPWICIGNFNEITTPNENGGGKEPKAYKMIAYSKSMDRCNLIDLGFKGPSFTWFNKRKRNRIFER